MKSEGWGLSGKKADEYRNNKCEDCFSKKWPVSCQKCVVCSEEWEMKNEKQGVWSIALASVKWEMSNQVFRVASCLILDRVYLSFLSRNMGQLCFTVLWFLRPILFTHPPPFLYITKVKWVTRVWPRNLMYSWFML